MILVNLDNNKEQEEWVINSMTDSSSKNIAIKVILNRATISIMLILNNTQHSNPTYPNWWDWNNRFYIYISNTHQIPNLMFTKQNKLKI